MGLLLCPSWNPHYQLGAIMTELDVEQFAFGIKRDIDTLGCAPSNLLADNIETLLEIQEQIALVIQKAGRHART